jgi:glycosyltransferase involved in cell wall biosynthesis
MSEAALAVAYPETDELVANSRRLAAEVAITALRAEGFLPQTEAAESDRSEEVFRLSRDPETYEVTVESDITLADCEQDTSPEDWALLNAWAEQARGKRIVFINPTMEGGGVAMMRPPLIHKLRLLGVDAHWYVMSGERTNADDPNPFPTTKLMHNIIQRRTSERLDDAGKAIHQEWNAENFRVLKEQETIQTADVFVIDDPQPSPLISQLKALNRNAKVIWRDHIDNRKDLMDDPTTPQGELWEYLRNDCGLDQVDACVFHPDIHDQFVPTDVHDKTFLMPATVEPRDDMNRRLSPEEVQEGIDIINREIREENVVHRILGQTEDVQACIDPKRDRIVLVARFDESKGMDKMIDYGVKVREEILRRRKEQGLPAGETPQIILIGNGSVDDPSGAPMLEKMRAIRRQLPDDVREDIILKRLSHNYMAINAAMYNSDPDAVVLGAQMSDAEGCETRITDWIEHDIPTIVAKRGGMPLQVIEGESGIVLDFDKPDLDFGRGVAFAADMITNREAYRAMRERTHAASESHNKREYTTTANLIRWLRVFDGVLTERPADKTWQIKHMPAPKLELAA